MMDGDGHEPRKSDDENAQLNDEQNGEGKAIEAVMAKRYRLFSVQYHLCAAFISSSIYTCTTVFWVLNS